MSRNKMMWASTAAIVLAAAAIVTIMFVGVNADGDSGNACAPACENDGVNAHWEYYGYNVYESPYYERLQGKVPGLTVTAGSPGETAMASINDGKDTIDEYMRLLGDFFNAIETKDYLKIIVDIQYLYELSKSGINVNVVELQRLMELADETLDKDSFDNITAKLPTIVECIKEKDWVKVIASLGSIKDDVVKLIPEFRELCEKWFSDLEPRYATTEPMSAGNIGPITVARYGETTLPLAFGEGIQTAEYTEIGGGTIDDLMKLAEDLFVAGENKDWINIIILSTEFHEFVNSGIHIEKADVQRLMKLAQETMDTEKIDYVIAKLQTAMDNVEKKDWSMLLVSFMSIDGDTMAKCVELCDMWFSADEEQGVAETLPVKTSQYAIYPQNVPVLIPGHYSLPVTTAKDYPVLSMYKAEGAMVSVSAGDRLAALDAQIEALEKEWNAVAYKLFEYKMEYNRLLGAIEGGVASDDMKIQFDDYKELVSSCESQLKDLQNEINDLKEQRDAFVALAPELN